MKGSELKDLQQSHTTALDEITQLKAEVQKGVEDIAKELKDGYDRCLWRLSNAGVDVATHSFDDYIRDYAAINPGGGSAGEAWRRGMPRVLCNWIFIIIVFIKTEYSVWTEIMWSLYWLALLC